MRQVRRERDAWRRLAESLQRQLLLTDLRRPKSKRALALYLRAVATEAEARAEIAKLRKTEVV